MSLKRSVGDSSFLVSRLSSPPLPPPPPKESRQEGKFIPVGGSRLGCVPQEQIVFPQLLFAKAAVAKKHNFLKSRGSCPPAGGTKEKLLCLVLSEFSCVC